MTDEEPEEQDEPTFRERVEQIRQEQADREDTDERPQSPGLEDMMGGGGMGGNPFAQMMGGMMGGGSAGSGIDSERIVRELARLREEVRHTGDQLERIADALEDD